MIKKVKIGIVGLSESAIQKHLPALLRRRNVEIVGAFDPDISKFDKANAALGTNLKFFNSYQELCFASDGLVICSPEAVHPSQIDIAVNEYSRPVMVEEACATSPGKLWERYQSVYDSPHLNILMFCDPEAERRKFSMIYQSFIEDIMNL